MGFRTNMWACVVDIRYGEKQMISSTFSSSATKDHKNYTTEVKNCISH